jgi:hypothetical protein
MTVRAAQTIFRHLLRTRVLPKDAPAVIDVGGAGAGRVADTAVRLAKRILGWKASRDALVIEWADGGSVPIEAIRVDFLANRTPVLRLCSAATA